MSMKDYNLRSRDIYGAPQRQRGPGWLKVGLLLVLVAAAAAVYLQLREGSTAPEPTSTHTKHPDIIPLTLPPRRSS